MEEIRWTVEAGKWLRDIHDYYKSEPEGDIRVLLYGHYRIAYLIRGKDYIDILGVFHGALDIDRYLL